MTTIAVSYDNTNCTVGCRDTATVKDSSIQWIADKPPTVSSFILSNFVPVKAFSQLPTAQNGWTGILTPGFMGDVSYDIAVTPVTSGKCTISQRQKTPRITVNAPIAAKNY
jgi:hypothetical protein